MSLDTQRPTPLQRTAAAWTLLAMASLAGCGGGGGGGGATPSGANNTAPTAAATLTGEAVANGDTVFNTSASTDPDGSITARSWDYGDGQTGTSDTHVYAQPGTYTARLTVTDNQGAKANASVSITVAKCSAAGLAAAGLSPFPSVCVQTSAGELVVEVYPKLAPITAPNFLKYVDDGFYNGTLFHRIIRNFVIQGGGYTTGLTYKTPTQADIALESNNGLKNTQYTLAMARGDAPNSANSQFFINLVNNPGLDYVAGANNGYAVFGQVISGTAVVDALGKVSANAAGTPQTEVVIRSMVKLP